MKLPWEDEFLFLDWRFDLISPPALLSTQREKLFRDVTSSWEQEKQTYIYVLFFLADSRYDRL